MIPFAEYFLPVLVAMTCALAYAFGAVSLRLSRRALGPALVRVLDVLGLTVAFFAANVVVGAIMLLAARHLAHLVVSLYTLTDVALTALSLLQAVAFQSWRAAGTRDDG